MVVINPAERLAIAAALIAAASVTATAPANAHDWRNHFSTDVPYRVINMTARGNLNVRTRPGRSGIVIARLRKGTRGIRLITCARHAAWCKIEVSVGGRTVTGWASMKYLGGYAD